MTTMLKEAAAEQAALSTHQRFVVMDGLRGIAAMAVVILHSFENRSFVPNGQLAVDLFFILSGFVIAFSYERRLAATMRKRDFIVARFVRLYPMLFVGALGGIVIALIHNKTNAADAYPMGSLLTSGALSLFVLPYLGLPLGNKAFTFNPPIWSLFFEIVANLLYVAFSRYLTVAVLIAIVVVSLLAVGLLGPLDGGSKAHILSGLPRVGAGFFGGVLLFRLWSGDRLPRVRGNIYVLGALILAIFCLPIDIGGWIYAPTFAILWLVVLAAANGSPSSGDRFCEFLGLVSYPVYLVHWLTLYVFTFVGAKIGLSGDRYWILATLHIAAIPFIGFIVARFYETPARLFLKRWCAMPRSVRMHRAA